MGDVKSDGQKFTAREVAEAVLRAGIDPAKVMRALERGRELEEGELRVEPPSDSGTVIPMNADADGTIELPYQRTESNRRSARVEHFTSRDRQAVLLMNLEPGERVVLYPDLKF